MPKRRRLSRAKSKSLFTKKAVKTKKVNYRASPMRGGNRL